MSAANIVRRDQEQREGPLQYPQVETAETEPEELPRESEPPEWVTAPPEQAADLLEPDFSDYGVQLASAEIADDGTELLEPVEADGKIAGFYRADVPMIPEHQTALPSVLYQQILNTLTARADGSPQPDKGNGANIVVVCGAFSPGQGEKARGMKLSAWHKSKGDTVEWWWGVRRL